MGCKGGLRYSIKTGNSNKYFCCIEMFTITLHENPLSGRDLVVLFFILVSVCTRINVTGHPFHEDPIP